MLYNKLINFAFSIVKNKQAAEDVVQTAYLKVLKNNPKVDDLDGYMMQSVKHGSFNYRRYKKFEDLDSVASAGYPPDQEDNFFARDVCEYMEKAALSHEQTIITLLTLFDDASMAQLSRELNKNTNTFKAQFHESIRKLKPIIEEEYGRHLG